MIRKMNRRTLTLLLIIFLASPAFSQEVLNEFGKNRVQYKEFNWQSYRSDNFDVYFYAGGQKNARQAILFLEEQFDRITDVIGYAPYKKTKIFLYNSVHDLQQSNVGVNDNLFTVGGQTNFVKAQVEISFTGSMVSFKEKLVYEVSEMLINDMMFGGSLTDMFQSSYLLSLPEWFTRGAARYIAFGWDVEMDDMARDLFANENNPKLSKYSGEEAALIGQSIWNYIAVKYGKSSISNILNLTRIIRNEENSIINTLGVPFRMFLQDWNSYYQNMNTQIRESYDRMSPENQIGRTRKTDLEYYHVSMSPDGRFVAFSENYRGKYRVRVLDTRKNKTKTVHSGGYKVINQEIDKELPLLSWQDNTTLGIVGVKHGQNYLWLYNTGSNNKQQRKLVRFNQVKDFSFIPGGRLLVLSADLNGQNDLFFFNPNRNTISRLTNDVYDDLNPRFIPGTESIVFSSNRPTDSLGSIFSTQQDINLKKDIEDNFNLFIYQYDTEVPELYRVTNTVSNDIKPIPVNDNDIFYLSDQRGIYNIYRYSLKDTVFNQVSNYTVSIQHYDLNPENNQLATIMLSDLTDGVFYDDDYDLSRNIFTPKTQRQQAIQARFVSERLARKKEDAQRKANANFKKIERLGTDDGFPSLPLVYAEKLNGKKPAKEKPQASEQDEPVQETISDFVDTENYQFDVETNESLNTDDYKFDTTEKKTVTERFNFDQRSAERQDRKSSFLARYRKLQQEVTVDGPFPYQSRFTADNLITSLQIDPLRGLGFQLETQMNDLLENHRFYGGVLAITDLRSGEVFGEYQYLKNRIDYHARYERNSIFRESEENPRTRHKYIFNKFEVGAALPLNVTSRIFFSPFYANTNFYDLSVSQQLSGPNSLIRENTENQVHYAGFKTGMVFDNTLLNGLNTYEGTKAKLTLQSFQGVTTPEKSFTNIELDVRHYQKIHREFILATRLFYGTYLGPNQQQYLLGGQDNWLFNRTDNENGDESPLAVRDRVDNSDILFVDFVPLRGFNYNKFNGTSVVSFSAELRLPIVRVLTRSPIASNFFRNLEFVGFYDVGSAWDSGNPFSEENSINTEIRPPLNNDAGFNPLVVEIQNFNNPWLSSYGFGMRTVLLGYYLKCDVAYPVENYEVGKPRFFFTLGYSF